MSDDHGLRTLLASGRRVEVGFLVVACLVVLLAVSVPFVAAGGGEGTADANASDVVDAGGGDLGSAASSVVDVDPDEPGVATVEGETYDSASAAVEAAAPGETVVLEGYFEERLNVSADDVRVVAGDSGAVLDGGGEGRVLTVSGENVTVEGLWIRGSGSDLGEEDAGAFLAGDGATLETVRISDSAYGVWVDGADEATIADVRIEGREDVHPRTERGNGIHLYETSDTTVRDGEIVETRDGIYFAWSDGVLAENNTISGARYGVHYMYSNDNRLVDNVAVDNGVGYALMVSEGLEIRDNVALRNDDTSGHGILVRDVDDSVISGNHLVSNRNGLFVYNAQDNEITDNLLHRNGVGIHDSAGSGGQLVAGNSFVENEMALVTPGNELAEWNGTDRGNYWSDARVADRTGDGVSEIRHRPSGLVENLVSEHPQAAVFADSPAFEAVRLAESSFPVIESPGVIDRHPLVEPPHDTDRYDDARMPAADGGDADGDPMGGGEHVESTHDDTENP